VIIKQIIQAFTALRERFATLSKEFEKANAKIEEQQTRLDEKDHTIALYQKIIFGPKTERYVNEQVNPGQPTLFSTAEPGGQTPQESDEKETITYERKKPKKQRDKGTGRAPLAGHLARIDIVIEPEEDTGGMVKIGEEITEVLDIIPPKFQVFRIIRPKYARPGSRTKDIENPIIVADMPERVIPRGIPSARLLAFLIVNKFVYHLPYHRQIQMFQRIGVGIKSNTINGWIAKVCVLLKPLYGAFCKQLFSANYLQADETKIRVFITKKGRKKKKAHTGYYWVYHDPLANNVVFIFDPGRGKEYPVEHLKNFAGKLQTDGYKVYDAFDLLDYVELIACLAHIRRKFKEAVDNDKERAEYALDLIQKLYKIEEFARNENYTPDQRLVLRHQKAKPIMEELKTWLDKQYDSNQVLPKSAIGKAITYALGRWKFLERYLEDGRLEIDNNLVENAIRAIAMGRKNYLFAGSAQGAKWGAMIYTFVASAIRHGHDPLKYLTDVIQRVNGTRPSQYHQLFPQNWKPAPENELSGL